MAYHEFMTSIRSGTSMFSSEPREVFVYDSGEEQAVRYSGYEFVAVIPKQSDDN